VTDQAYWLGFAATIASLPWLNEYLDRVAAVTVADIQRVAETYLTARNRTIGWFTPEEAGDGETGEADDESL
jgi:predicted Zn-dependent peptidase